MSNLILPSMYENKMLEKNLTTFFSRYPHERSRLEHLLSRPVENRALPQIEQPPVPSTPPMRVLLLAGIGSPVFIANLLNNPLIRDDTFQVFIIENNLEFLQFCFQYTDISQLIAYEKTEWLLMQSQDLVKSSFFRVLKREHVASMMKNVHILETNVPQPEEVSAFYKELPAIYDETVGHVFHNFGRINDSLEGVLATMQNEKALINYPGIADLKDTFRGIPALIIGAGPSLDRELETIKANNDKFVILAADAALKPLLKAGIRVDYVTSIERLNDYQKPFFDNLDPIETELVAFPVIKPDQFDIYPGPIRICYRNYSYFAYFERGWPKGILSCGGSTSHLALRLAAYFGCSSAYLIGIDSCYEQQEGTDLYRSHCSNTGHSEWGNFIPLEDFHKERRHMPPMIAVNNQDREVMTNLTYYQWVKEFTEELATTGQIMRLTNCSTLGLKIEGIPFKPLSEVAAKLEPKFDAKPKPLNSTFNRKAEHKILNRNFEGWSQLITDCIMECDALIEQENIDQLRYEALLITFNFRMAIDPMFVAFVVQCCAKEFFEYDNVWWGLNKAWNVDQRDKLKVTREKFKLFKRVVDQLLAIFKETRKTDE